MLKLLTSKDHQEMQRKALLVTTTHSITQTEYSDQEKEARQFVKLENKDNADS